MQCTNNTTVHYQRTSCSHSSSVVLQKKAYSAWQGKNVKWLNFICFKKCLPVTWQLNEITSIFSQKCQHSSKSAVTQLFTVSKQQALYTLFLLRTKTTEVLFISVGNEQAQNGLISHYLSFVITLKPMNSSSSSSVSDLNCLRTSSSAGVLSSSLSSRSSPAFQKPIGDYGYFHTSPCCQDPLADLSKSCSSNATSFGEWFLAASHPRLPLNL